MIRALRKWWLRHRIEWSLWDQEHWQSGIRNSTAELELAKRRESLLRQKLTEVDHPLPHTVRTRGLA